MANKSFNFGKMKRSFYTTTLKDGKVVIVNMPKKSTFEKMQEISDLDEEEVDGKEVYKTMLSLMAENKSGLWNYRRGWQSTLLRILQQRKGDRCKMAVCCLRKRNGILP